MVTVGVMSSGFAQPEIAAGGGMGGPGGRGMGPRGGGPMMPPGGPRRIVMHAAGGSLYVLQGNELVKYDGDTLKQQGAVTLPDAKPDGANAEGPRPPLGAGPADFLVAGNDVLLVAGGSFYLIDARTMRIDKQAALPVRPADAQGGIRPPFGPPPQLELGGKTLYVASGNQLYSIDIAAGKVTGQVELELPMGPPPGGPFGGNAPRR
jgi:hypothetical protein